MAGFVDPQFVDLLLSRLNELEEHHTEVLISGSVENIESYKLFIKPKEVISDQIQILEESKQSYDKKIKNILTSQGFAWSNFSDEMKETFLINLMKQKGVKFVDKSKVKEVLKRKVSRRKVGQRPKNKLRDRVKNKK